MPISLLKSMLIKSLMVRILSSFNSEEESYLADLNLVKMKNLDQRIKERSPNKIKMIKKTDFTLPLFNIIDLHILNLIFNFNSFLN
jgi:hypothetical protein